MKRVLHIVKDPGEKKAFEVIEQQCRTDSREVLLLLIHDAVRLTPSGPATVYVLKEDAETRGIQPSFPVIGYGEMLDLIFSSDAVTIW